MLVQDIIACDCDITEHMPWRNRTLCLLMDWQDRRWSFNGPISKPQHVQGTPDNTSLNNSAVLCSSFTSTLLESQ